MGHHDPFLSLPSAAENTNQPGFEITPGADGNPIGDNWIRLPSGARIQFVPQEVPPSPLSPSIATRGEAAAAEHYSLREGGSIERLIRLRQKHFALGHTPETDASRGPAFFLQGAQTFLDRSKQVRTPDKARSHLISAIGMLIALADRNDFIAQNEDQT